MRFNNKDTKIERIELHTDKIQQASTTTLKRHYEHINIILHILIQPIYSYQYMYTYTHTSFLMDSFSFKLFRCWSWVCWVCLWKVLARSVMVIALLTWDINTSNCSLVIFRAVKVLEESCTVAIFVKSILLAWSLGNCPFEKFEYYMQSS